MSVQNPWRHHMVNTINAHVRILQENGQLYVWLSMEEMLDLCNRAVLEKTPQII